MQCSNNNKSLLQKLKFNERLDDKLAATVVVTSCQNSGYCCSFFLFDLKYGFLFFEL